MDPAYRNFLSWVVNCYHEHRQQAKDLYPYKIVDKKFSKKIGEDVLVIQAPGKNISFIFISQN